MEDSKWKPHFFFWTFLSWCQCGSPCSLVQDDYFTNVHAWRVSKGGNFRITCSLEMNVLAGPLWTWCCARRYVSSSVWYGGISLALDQVLTELQISWDTEQGTKATMAQVGVMIEVNLQLVLTGAHKWSAFCLTSQDLTDGEVLVQWRLIPGTFVHRRGINIFQLNIPLKCKPLSLQASVASFMSLSL